MKEWAIIFGAIILCILIVESEGGICTLFSDPNDYIDDPNVLQNGTFECGDPNLTNYNFTPPIYWKRNPTPADIGDCYAAVHSEFLDGSIRWTISDPYEGDKFALLSTGNHDIDRDIKIRVSSISQNVFISPGDTIKGAYFFGTTDYLPYNDYGQIRLELIDPNSYPNSKESISIPNTYCNVDIVGDKQSTRDSPSDISGTTDGWIPFTYTFNEPNEFGHYSLICEVVDVGDEIINSYYAVDDLRICAGGIPQADLDLDCDVDLADYSILSEAWLCFCPDEPFYDPNNLYDPNDYPPPVTDPNILCDAADLDNSWYVDPNDIAIMSNQWLINAPSE